MTKYAWTASTAALVVGTFSGLGACSSDTCIDNDTCSSRPEGGAEAGGDADGGDGGDVDVPPGCDPSADVKDAAACVVDSYGVFVDGAGGSDANAGTKSSPKETVAGALSALGGRGRVYVCGAGPYEGGLKLAGGGAASVYGGFVCGSWSYDGTKAELKASGGGYGVEVTGASGVVVLSDVSVEAGAVTSSGASSVGVFVSGSSLTLRRVEVRAGKGTEGVSGVELAAFMPERAPDGTPGADGGGAKVNPSCTTSVGGAGGKDGTPNGAGGQVAVSPVFPTDATGAGGTGGGTCAAGLGTDGSYGVAGGAGAGAPNVGALDATGWKGSDGTVGGAGGDGQGGGGGAQRNAGGVGGSGGAGGCGGAGGAKGTSGGSSIAVLSFESTLVLEGSRLFAQDAGRGGNGAKGQKGQLNQLNTASPNSAANACSGGIGGVGGSGGGGGGGAGGVSAGIVYKGAAPRIDGAPVTASDTHASVTLGDPGLPGGKGLGGDAAQTTAPASRAGLDGTDGAAGVAKAVMSAP
ncbi:MAG: hypothetical protein KF850_39235 [Labilithrix sp.]|nr:hypothetical protein [Labilithrix sp.]